MAAVLTAEDDRPLHTWWVKKAMVLEPAAAAPTGTGTLTDPDTDKREKKWEEGRWSRDHQDACVTFHTHSQDQHIN